MPPRSTPLLAFKPPFVKGGEIALPILTGAGEWAEITAVPSLWSDIREALEMASWAGVLAPTARGPFRRLHGKARHRVFHEVRQRIERDGLTRKAACAEAHIAPSAFSAWLAGQRRVPVTKPSGCLL
ncbi:MAG: hypothetical protein HZC55_26535 [Verrucomicrobia bacterium]|nr:hypothetical protein [Verrucomicrobiota bacterium]